MKKNDPYVLTAKLLFALSLCKRNKSDKELCARLHKLGCVARDLAFQRDVEVSEVDFAAIRDYRAQAREGYKKARKAYDSATLPER